jgi:hypothetical protein
MGDKSDWRKISYTGKYKFLRKKKIHILHHENPAEEGFVVIAKLTTKELVFK